MDIRRPGSSVMMPSTPQPMRRSAIGASNANPSFSGQVQTTTFEPKLVRFVKRRELGQLGVLRLPSEAPEGFDHAGDGAAIVLHELAGGPEARLLGVRVEEAVRPAGFVLARGEVSSAHAGVELLQFLEAPEIEGLYFGMVRMPSSFRIGYRAAAKALGSALYSGWEGSVFISIWKPTLRCVIRLTQRTTSRRVGMRVPSNGNWSGKNLE